MSCLLHQLLHEVGPVSEVGGDDDLVRVEEGDVLVSVHVPILDREISRFSTVSFRFTCRGSRCKALHSTILLFNMM